MLGDVELLAGLFFSGLSCFLLMMRFGIFMLLKSLLSRFEVVFDFSADFGVDVKISSEIGGGGSGHLSSSENALLVGEIGVTRSVSSIDV